MQVVYITNRPEVLAETLGHVRLHMPWVDHAVVVAPDRHLQRRPDMGLPVTWASDEEILGSGHSELAKLDHTTRNIRIRKGVLASGLTDEVFLLSDDDYRPIKPIPPEFYVGDGGRFHSYYSYDLAAWRWTNTPFDRGQHQTYLALTYLGCGHLSFAAHMPQVMDRAISTEAYEAVSRLTACDTLCEWSLYFNYGQHFYPDRFLPPEPYCTVGWPDFAGSWPFWVRPGPYAFENFYESLYEPGQMFEGLPTSADPGSWERTGFEKARRWYELELAATRLDFRATPMEPWTRGSPARRAAFAVLRRMRWAMAYLTIEERIRLSELAGDVDRLRRELADR